MNDLKTNLLRASLSGFFLFFQLNAFSNVHHWETAIFAEDVWHYFEGSEQPDAHWNDTSFSAAGWLTGSGGFGYGDEDDGTITSNVMSVYSRIDFTIESLEKITNGIIHYDFDDAIIIYLNGEEITRSGITVEDPNFDTPASTKHEAQMIRGGYPESYMIVSDQVTNILHEGKNTLAVQVHNKSLESSDLSSIVYLSFGIKDESVLYEPVPGWFIPPAEISSNLPLVVINTKNQLIDREMITATMRIIDNGYDSINTITDSANVYSGFVGIRLRGHASAGFPQKPYRFETRDSLGENLNVSLLGMPQENDWALINNYKDRTFVKHSLGYRLSNSMGHYAPRMKHCEVILNGVSQGIYMLSELIKQDKNRVNIANLKPKDIEGDQLTGGYIFKVDYFEEDSSDSWIPWYRPPHNPNPVHLVYKDPDEVDLLEPQKQYIQDWIEQFERVLYSNNFKDTIYGYRAYINVSSFINYLIIQEVALNNDGYKKSCHFHKDKDRDNIRALLNAGPVWDLDWGWRPQSTTSNDPSRGFLTGLEYNRTLEVLSPTPVTWMPRLMEDEQFANEVYTSFNMYRQTLLNSQFVANYIDSIYNFLGDAKDRHYDLWHNTSGNKETYYYEQKEILKDWITDRLSWLDDNLPGEVIDTANFISSPITYIDSSLIVIPPIVDTTVTDTIITDTIINPISFTSKQNASEIRIYPSIVRDRLFVYSESGIEEIQILSLSGDLLHRYQYGNERDLLINTGEYRSGMYFIRVKLNSGNILLRKFIKYPE